MELIDVKKTRPGQAEMTIFFGGTRIRYDITYANADIFVVSFPDELKRLLHLMPVSVTQSIVSKLGSVLTADGDGLPFKIEVEKEILALV